MSASWAHPPFLTFALFKGAPGSYNKAGRAEFTIPCLLLQKLAPPRWADFFGQEPLHSIRLPRFEGKQNVRQGLAARSEGLSDVHYENAEHFVDSESQTGISKWCLTGTGRDGKKLQVQGCDFYTFRAGKVVRKDSYWKLVE